MKKNLDEVREKMENAATIGADSLKKVKKIPIVDEFKNFIARGNVMELSVGVIIGASFQNLVTSFTNNIISPILGCFTEVDFSAHILKIGKLSLKYGAFLTDVINFMIMAFIVFLLVKFMNKLFVYTKKEDKNEKKTSHEEVLLEEIRDLLKEKLEK